MLQLQTKSEQANCSFFYTGFICPFWLLEIAQHGSSNRVNGKTKSSTLDSTRHGFFRFFQSTKSRVAKRRDPNAVTGYLWDRVWVTMERYPTYFLIRVRMPLSDASHLTLARLNICFYLSFAPCQETAVCLLKTKRSKSNALLL